MSQEWRQRLAIVAGGIAATVVLTVGLAAAGFTPIQPDQPVDAADAESLGEVAVGETSLEPEVVYVKPAPPPKEIVLKRQATAANAGGSARVTGTVSRDRDEREDDEDRYERRERRDSEREKERHEREDEDDD